MKKIALLLGVVFVGAFLLFMDDDSSKKPAKKKMLRDYIHKDQ